jgi:hypothetical protein
LSEAAIEPLPLLAARIFTSAREKVLTNASEFFFAQGARVSLVTSQHVAL